MKDLIKWTVCCWVLSTLALSQFTLPLASHQVKEHIPRHLSHNLAGHQTYALKPMRTIFTLPLVVEGLTYGLSIDTGSSDLFIKGFGMEGNPQTKYRCDACEKNNDKLKIGYLDGFLDTYHLNASIQLGDHEFKQDILVAYHTTSINFKKMGGIVGLSFQEVARNPNPNFINTLINQKIIQHYIFAVKLNFKTQNTSFITFGGFDEKFIAKGHHLTYYNIKQNSRQYRLALKQVVLGDKTLSIDEALLDTGNTCISIPDRYTEDIINEFNTVSNKCYFEDERGNKQFQILECLVGNFDELPTLEIHIEDEVLPITKQYYLEKCKPFGKGYKCTTLLENVKWRLEIFLGDTFFLRYYAVFDLEQKRIGLVKNDDRTTLRDIITGS